jgi:Pyruvate/2-oxoacid:ferredoxin oxidoreductase delta subunit
MKLLTFFIVTLLISVGFLPEVTAWRQKNPVTPYGDYCPRCTKYGNCKNIMSHEDAKKAMLDYYHKKGLGVELEKKRGRFIRAKIKENDRVIDIIIFDRQTGRVRSIY